MVGDDMVWFWAKSNKKCVWKILNTQQENGYETNYQYQKYHDEHSKSYDKCNQFLNNTQKH